jgi:glycerol kinase
MYINRGKDKFMILDITNLEIQIIGDAFSMSRANLAEILKKKDAELSKYFGVPTDKLPEIRTALKRNLTFFDTHFKKIMSYVSEKPQA